MRSEELHAGYSASMVQSVTGFMSWLMPRLRRFTGCKRMSPPSPLRFIFCLRSRPRIHRSCHGSAFRSFRLSSVLGQSPLLFRLRSREKTKPPVAIVDELVMTHGGQLFPRFSIRRPTQSSRINPATGRATLRPVFRGRTVMFVVGGATLSASGWCRLTSTLRYPGFSPLSKKVSNPGFLPTSLTVKLPNAKPVEMETWANQGEPTAEVCCNQRVFEP